VKEHYESPWIGEVSEFLINSEDKIRVVRGLESVVSD